MRWPGLILALFGLGGATQLRHRKAIVNETTTGRALQAVQNSFQALNCNKPACNKGTRSWTALGFNVAKQKVVIPCGLCVNMDYVGDDEQVLRLPFGLEVLGTLIFPNNYRLTIETPFIIVQGTLKMTATRIVKDVPLIHVKLTGTNEVSFLPIDNNANACSGKPCSMGVQPIAVAGGTVDLRGVPSTCKTWTRLHDVVDVASVQEPIAREFDRPAALNVNHANPLCRKYDPYVRDDFSSGTTSLWTAGYGAYYGWSNGFLRVSGRKDKLEHAPTLDMLPFQDCLVAGATYLFSARVRLNHNIFSGNTRTNCNSVGDDCLTLQYTVQRANAKVGSLKGREFPSDAFGYGRWEEFYASFTFSNDEIQSGALYQLLRLRGPAPGVEIHVDDVTFGLAPPSLFPNPDDVCGGNLIMNGDAEASPLHPFPMYVSGGKLNVLTTNTGNRVFRVKNRSSDNDGLQQDLMAPQCLKTGALYDVRARVRFESASPVVSKMNIRILFTNGSSSVIEAAKCSLTGSAWGECNGKVTIVKKFEPSEVQDVRVFFVTEGSSGVTMDVDDWRMEVAKPPKSGIVVPSEGIVDCWGEGVKIALTSHTLDHNDVQVRQLVSAPVDLGNGYARLELDDVIIFPVTALQDEDFAVEVMLLNRNIRFEGGTERIDKGGHFIVFHTPQISQMISGVEFRNFGQLGDLGRYPIHMHMCESTRSSIEKNLILDSNQRCVVIHGTHNTTVSENVAFRTAGHCFLTEDGGEMSNNFIRNIGASTRAAARTVRAGETDNTNPSTFWISNPKNNFIGNVAAGGEGNGFWFELQTSVKFPSSEYEWARNLNPRFLPLTTFRDNVAHSNGRDGFRTYPHGFLPPSVGVFENIRSYRNRQDGLFLRSTDNIKLSGGAFADNQVQLSFEISQNIVVDGTKMIGRTDRFHEIVEAQGKGTFFHDERLVGMELHVTTIDLLKMGSTVKNVKFSKFDQGFATGTALFEVNIDSTRTWDGVFNFWTLLENNSVDDMSVTTLFDLKRTTAEGHAAVYLVDKDSSFKPPGTSALSSSTIIADLDDVKAFATLDRCHSNGIQKYLYCRNTCLRTVIVSIDPSATDLTLVIADKTNPSRSFAYSGAFPTEFLGDGSLDKVANTDWNKYISFAAALPVGSYEAQFKRGATTVWPTFAEIVWGPALCDNGASPNSIRLVEPSIGNPGCQELIRNGNMEGGTISPWLHSFGAGLAVESRKGRGGSKALGDLNQSTSFSGIGQYVDTRCLQTGTIAYEIRVWVRLERADGSDFVCGQTNCGPTLKVRTTSGAGVGLPLERNIRLLSPRFELPIKPDWNLLRAVVTLDKNWTDAHSVFVYVERGRTGTRLWLDDFTMTRVQ